jgi:hypothetical protein
MPMTQNVSAGAFGMATMPPAGSIAGGANATLNATAPGGAQAAAGVNATTGWFVGIAIVLVAIRVLHEKYGASLD